MAESNNRDERRQEQEQNRNKEQSIGNQQGTTQTGAQNNGGQTVKDHDDQYTEDLEQSGDRSASGPTDR